MHLFVVDYSTIIVSYPQYTSRPNTCHLLTIMIDFDEKVCIFSMFLF